MVQVKAIDTQQTDAGINQRGITARIRRKKDSN